MNSPKGPFDREPAEGGRDVVEKQLEKVQPDERKSPGSAPRPDGKSNGK